jgi:TRAP-type C4-dicarboxylate transport system permease small subunit
LIDRLTSAVRFVEDALLVALLSAMIALAAYQVVARNFFDTGIMWGDSLVRVLVLWVTFVGATIASRADEHIRIDLLTRFIGERSDRWLARVRNLFTTLIAGAFAWYSLEFVLLDYEDGIIAFAGVPAWICEAVMPVGGALIAFRYLLHAVNPP